jgi:histidine ammonia-lyase
MTPTPTILLTGAGVTIDDVVRVARSAVPVALGPAARARVVAARAVVDRLAQSDTAIYGVNSALGANTGKPIAPDDLAAYQERAVQARAVGVGPRFTTDVVRAMLFARASGMAVGGSGISPGVLDALMAQLNAGVHPVVPSWFHLPPTWPRCRISSFHSWSGPRISRRSPGAQALERAGMQPVHLAAKDGVALISANAATVGHAALVVRDCASALDALNIAAALSFEGFRANLSPLDPRAQAAHPAPGQAAIATRLTTLLAGSGLWQTGAARRVQDPLSLRCVSQVHGAALAAVWSARDQVELELNSAAESPLVIADANAMLSNGNFDVAGLALAFDTLGLALAQSAMLCVQRCLKHFTPALSGLPLQLTTYGPEHSGFATIQKTLVAVYSVIRHLANPASLDSVPVSEMVEDHASMGASRGQGRCHSLAFVHACRDRVARRSTGRRFARRCRQSAGHRCSARPGRGPCASADARRRSSAGPRRRDRLRVDRRRRASRGRPARPMKWLSNNWDQVLVALGEHIVISFTSLAIAFALSLAIGIWAARSDRVFRWSLAISGFLYTIPTLAFLALLIPVVGLGRTNAIICMVAFSLMIMIRNVATGIREVPADVVDAARGMGMRPIEILAKIELPLALPVIVAGLRIATVTVISVAVVAAYINAGGLGTLIFNGISNDFAPKIWAGALTSCALAVAADLSLASVEAWLRHRAN